MADERPFNEDGYTTFDGESRVHYWGCSNQEWVSPVL